MCTCACDTALALLHAGAVPVLGSTPRYSADCSVVDCTTRQCCLHRGRLTWRRIFLRIHPRSGYRADGVDVPFGDMTGRHPLAKSEVNMHTTCRSHIMRLMLTDLILLILITSRPCRTLFGSCPPPELGTPMSPTPCPCHVRAQAAMKPRHHGRQSCLCLCPAPISFMP